MQVTPITPLSSAPAPNRPPFVPIIAILVIGLALSIGKIFLLSSDVKEAKDELSNLQNQIAEKAAVEKDLADTQAMSLYLSEKFDELDIVLLDTDSNCVDFIEWIYDNAFFENVPQAQAQYDAWEREQDRTNEVYAALKEELDEYFGVTGGEDTDVQVQ